MLEEGRSNLGLRAELYRRQSRSRRHLLQEHPAIAISWREPEIDAPRNSPKVFTVVFDQCRSGLTTKSADAKGRDPAMKPSRFLTTSQQMVECLDKRCDRSHKHEHLSGGRAGEVAFYPLPLIRAILKGVTATADSETYHRDNVIEQHELINAIAETQASLPTSASQGTPTSEITRTKWRQSEDRVSRFQCQAPLH